MVVATEEYSAGACARGHLQRVILACPRGTRYFGLNLYDIGAFIGFDSGLHRLVDETWILHPVALVAGALHANEMTTRMIVKVRVCQQVFYFAIAKKKLRKSGACRLATLHQVAMRSSCVSTTEVVSAQTSVLHTERETTQPMHISS